MNASAEQRGPTTPDPPTTAEHIFVLRHTPEAVQSMRHRARTILEAEDLPGDTIQDGILVISELATNALRHALPPAYLRLSLPVVADGYRTVRIEVTDSGPARPPHLTRHRDREEHGRGLEIVSALSTRCGSRVHNGWSIRWSELSTPLNPPTPDSRAGSGCVRSAEDSQMNESTPAGTGDVDPGLFRGQPKRFMQDTYSDDCMPSVRPRSR